MEWWAEIVDPDVYKGPADLLFEPDVDDPAIDGTSKDRHFHLAELNQNPGRCDLLFKKPALGHTATELDASAKRNIRTWLTGLWGDAQVRPHGFALKIRITGSKGVAADARRAARFLAIRNFIQLEMSSNAPELYKHPGLNPDGTVKEGSLVVADVVDMSRSHWRLLAVNLPALNPDDPGRLAGPEDAQHCPISVYYEFEPQSVGLGMAGQGAQTGEMVLDLDPAAPKCVADTALHELGHQFGLSNIGHALPGIPAPKSIVSNETLARYRDLGVKGNYYTGMGHSGGHCAWGLNDADKANADPPGFTRRRGKCIMFGAMGRDDSRSTMTGFCPQCADRARAQDLNRLL